MHVKGLVERCCPQYTSQVKKWPYWLLRGAIASRWGDCQPSLPGWLKPCWRRMAWTGARSFRQSPQCPFLPRRGGAFLLPKPPGQTLLLQLHWGENQVRAMPLGWAQSPVAQEGDEQDSCHACLACLQLGLRPGETWAWFCHSLFGWSWILWCLCVLPLVWGYLLSERLHWSCQFYSILYSFTLFPDQSGAGTERAQTLKEEGNELVKKGNHKKAVEKYSESLKLRQECATYTNRYYYSARCPSTSWPFIKPTVVFLTELSNVWSQTNE